MKRPSATAQIPRPYQFSTRDFSGGIKLEERCNFPLGFPGHGISQILKLHLITGFSFLDSRLGKSRDLEKGYRKGIVARSIQDRRSLRLMDGHAGVGIEGGTLRDALKSDGSERDDGA